MHHHFHDLKLYILNFFAFGLQFSEIDTSLKIILSITAIGYTIRRWVIMERENDKNKKE